ncbi:PREDICTED: allatostatin-A receptor-like [Branchiostoma belcheri]|uniref:Allatostatin-A receptor-like n=1 Tax=Branchiostoma belcheri TaxID=7741 RepID=A0A6P4YGN1_BRABE|nr:PREDICTED: allatostatin-A receptor-like [Branchiostoma belcheri]
MDVDTQYIANVARCVLSAVGVAANLLILYIIARYRTVRTISNVYVANLAVADASFCLLAFVQGLFSMRFRYFDTRLQNLLASCQQGDNGTSSTANGTVSNATTAYLQTTNNCTWRSLEPDQLTSLQAVKLSWDGAYMQSSVSCDIGRLLAVFLACASVFLLTATAAERHGAVTRPLQHRLRRTQGKAFLTCLLMWGLALLVAALDTTVRNAALGDWSFTYGSLFQCVYLRRDDAASGHAFLPLAVVIFILMYAVPAAVIIPLYGRIFRALRQPRPRASRSPTSRTLSRAARSPTPRTLQRASTSRTLHMIFVVTVFFLVCWLPFHVTSVLVHWHTDGDSNLPFLVATALAILNSVINPFLYAFIGKNFREHIRRVFCSSPCEEEGTHYHSNARASVDSIYGYRDSVVSIYTDTTIPDVQPPTRTTRL